MPLTKDPQHYAPLQNSSREPRIFRPAGQLLAVVVALEDEGHLAGRRVSPLLGLATGLAGQYLAAETPDDARRRRTSPGLAAHGHRPACVNLIFGQYDVHCGRLHWKKAYIYIYIHVYECLCLCSYGGG